MFTVWGKWPVWWRPHILPVKMLFVNHLELKKQILLQMSSNVLDDCRRFVWATQVFCSIVMQLKLWLLFWFRSRPKISVRSHPGKRFCQRNPTKTRATETRNKRWPRSLSLRDTSHQNTSNRLWIIVFQYLHLLGLNNFNCDVFITQHYVWLQKIWSFGSLFLRVSGYSCSDIKAIKDLSH